MLFETNSLASIRPRVLKELLLLSSKFVMLATSTIQNLAEVVRICTYKLMLVVSTINGDGSPAGRLTTPSCDM